MSRAALAALLVAASGCDVVFDTTELEPIGGKGCGGETDEDGFADEDGDGFADSCDNCPGTENSDQADTGELMAGLAADGVGDACDPTYAEPGDRLHRFITFATAADANAWNVISGTWVVKDGAYYYDMPARDTDYQKTALTLPLPERYEVQTRVHVDTIQIEAAEVAEFTILADYDPDSTVHQCTLATTEARIYPGSEVVGSALLQPDATIPVTASLRGDVLTCAFDATVLSSDEQPLATTPPVLALEGRSITVRFDYLAIYELAPSARKQD